LHYGQDSKRAGGARPGEKDMTVSPDFNRYRTADLDCAQQAE